MTCVFNETITESVLVNEAEMVLDDEILAFSLES